MVQGDICDTVRLICTKAVLPVAGQAVVLHHVIRPNEYASACIVLDSVIFDCPVMAGIVVDDALIVVVERFAEILNS